MNSSDQTNSYVQDDVIDQVNKIISTEEFKKTKILTDFLTFIVDETLEGNEDSLKEYVIATNVLTRNPDFDPQVNAIVRIHAHRLRKKLKNYYNTEGRFDKILITMPKGRYIPFFSENNDLLELKRENNKGKSFKKTINPKPVLAVLPLQNIEGDEQIKIVCSVLCHELSLNLSKFSEMNVIANFSMTYAVEHAKNVNDVISQLNIDYILTGNCFSDEKGTKVNIELIDIHNNHILWAESFYLRCGKEKKDLSNYQGIIQKVIAMTCGYFGVVYREILNTDTPAEMNDLYGVFILQKYLRSYTREAYEEALVDIEKGLKKNPRNAILTAFKAQLYLNLLTMDVEEREQYLKMGTELVEKAIHIDPNCQHAFQVLAWANILHHNENECRRSIKRMQEINPYHVMYTASAGFALVCLGDYEKGFNLMSEAVELNPYYNWYINLGFCLCFLASSEYEEALHWANMINRKGSLWDSILRTSCLGLYEPKQDYTDNLIELNTLSPNFSKKARRLIGTFIFDKKLQEVILEGLVSAGVQIEN